MLNMILCNKKIKVNEMIVNFQEHLNSGRFYIVTSTKHMFWGHAVKMLKKFPVTLPPPQIIILRKVTH